MSKTTKTTDSDSLHDDDSNDVIGGIPGQNFSYDNFISFFHPTLPKIYTPPSNDTPKPQFIFMYTNPNKKSNELMINNFYNDTPQNSAQILNSTKYNDSLKHLAQLQNFTPPTISYLQTSSINTTSQNSHITNIMKHSLANLNILLLIILQNFQNCLPFLEKVDLGHVTKDYETDLTAHPSTEPLNSPPVDFSNCDDNLSQDYKSIPISIKNSDRLSAQLPQIEPNSHFESYPYLTDSQSIFSNNTISSSDIYKTLLCLINNLNECSSGFSEIIDSLDTYSIASNGQIMDALEEIHASLISELKAEINSSPYRDNVFDIISNLKQFPSAPIFFFFFYVETYENLRFRFLTR